MKWTITGLLFEVFSPTFDTFNIQVEIEMKRKKKKVGKKITIENLNNGFRWFSDDKAGVYYVLDAVQFPFSRVFIWKLLHDTLRFADSNTKFNIGHFFLVIKAPPSDTNTKPKNHWKSRAKTEDFFNFKKCGAFVCRLFAIQRKIKPSFRWLAFGSRNEVTTYKRTIQQ